LPLGHNPFRGIPDGSLSGQAPVRLVPHQQGGGVSASRALMLRKSTSTPSNCVRVPVHHRYQAPVSVAKGKAVRCLSPLGMVTTRCFGPKDDPQPTRLSRRDSSQTERWWVRQHELVSGLRYSRRCRGNSHLLLHMRAQLVHRSVGEPAEGSLTHRTTGGSLNGRGYRSSEARKNGRIPLPTAGSPRVFHRRR
jgi:hypothetical protein